MSYCILESTAATGAAATGAAATILIRDWAIISLVDDEPASTCSWFRKDGTPCGFQGKMTCCRGDESLYFCKRHEAEHATVVDDAVVVAGLAPGAPAPAGTCCMHVLPTSKQVCGKRGRYVARHDGLVPGAVLCGAHRRAREAALRRVMRLRPVRRVNANTVPIDELKLRLFQELDARPQLLRVDEMVIENQPVHKNPRMKSISNALFDYFLLRGVVDRAATGSTLRQVRFMCPSNKLKVDADNTVRTLARTADGEKYKLTKALAVQYCTQLVADDPVYSVLLRDARKKDDLSDCYLQGVYYLTCRRTR